MYNQHRLFVSQKHFILRVLLFTCYCLAFTCMANGADGANQPYWATAAKHYQAGNYLEAQQEVDAQLESHPEDPLLLRIKGVCLIELDQPDRAAEIFNKIIDRNPNDVAARYYLAQAYAYRGSIKEALKQLETVTALAPNSEYARLAANARPQLESLGQSSLALNDDNRWNLYLKLGQEYDDNVPARADNSVETSPQDSWRSTYSFYGEIRYPDQKLDPLGFTLGLGYSLDGSYYSRSEFHDYNLLFQSVNAFISRQGTLFNKSYELRLKTRYMDTNLDNDPYSTGMAIGSSFEIQWFQQFSTAAMAEWTHLDYEDDIPPYQEYYSRDGDTYSCGLDSYLHLLENRLLAGLHYQFRRDNTVGMQYELRSNDLAVSMRAALPLALRLQTRIGYQEEDYLKFVTDPPGRLDDIWSFHFSLQRPLWQEAVLLETHYTYLKSSSSQDFAEYERSVAGINLILNY